MTIEQGPMATEARKVIFQFVGGPHDGRLLSASLDRPDYTEASSIYRDTDNAAVGRRFWCYSEYSLSSLRTTPLQQLERLEANGYRFPGHVYEIVLRIQHLRDLRVRVKHVRASEF